MEKNRDKRIKMTPQRIAIFDYLEGNKTHPSADEIYRAVSKKYPTMSFATVYNTMSALRDRGAVRELAVDPAKKRYDPDTVAHNHLICVGCRRIVDVPMTCEVRLPMRLRHDFTMLDNHVEFRGLCPACRKRSK